MTIRAKLYAAIVMTVLGPVVTIAVAIDGMGALDKRFGQVEERAARQRLALELKFDLTDLNGWQTAYGYDRGRSRPRFLVAREAARRDLSHARRVMRERRERELVGRIERELAAFLRLDEAAWRALGQGRYGRVRTILLGAEITHFDAMAGHASALAAYQARRAAATRRAFDEERREVRRRLVGAGLGAAVLIVLLLVTAQDVARAALERRIPGADVQRPGHSAPEA